MKNYYFDNTNESKPFTHELDATEDTLPPDNALRIAPEFKDGYHPCEQNGKWVLVEDNRKKTAYNIETKEAVKIDYIGEIKEGFTLLEPFEYSKWDTENKIWVKDEEAERKAKVPPSISRFQMMAFLKITSYADKPMYDWVNNFVNNLDGSSEENIILKTAWETAPEFTRDSFPVMTAQKLFELTDEQGDEFFIAASKITT